MPKSTLAMFCGKCDKKVAGMHELHCDPVNRYANPYICKDCLDKMTTAVLRPYQREAIDAIRRSGKNPIQITPKNLGNP